jgi:hypothetical protein
VRPKKARVQPDAGNPLADQSGVSLRCYGSVPAATAAEEELARLLFWRLRLTVNNECHPDTKRPIVATPIPQSRALMRLVVSAAEILPSIRT